MTDRYDRQADELVADWNRYRAKEAIQRGGMQSAHEAQLARRIATALRAAVAEEREAAAKIADERHEGRYLPHRCPACCAAMEIAACIRARGEETPDAL